MQGSLDILQADAKFVRVWLSVTGAARMLGRTPSDADSDACLTKKEFSTSAFSASLLNEVA